MHSAAIQSGDHTPSRSGGAGAGGIQFHPFGAPANKVKASPKRSNSNVETLRHKKQTLDQNLKQMFQKGTRFAQQKGTKSTIDDLYPVQN